MNLTHPYLIEAELGKSYGVRFFGRSTARKIQSPEDKGTLEKAKVAMVQTNRNKK